MTSSLQPLTALLEQQVSLQQQADALLKSLKRALISGDTEAIMAINKELLALGNTIKQSEQDRQRFLHDKGYTQSRLKDLLPALPNTDRQHIASLRNRLKTTIENVQREKAETDSLIQQSMDWVNQTVKAIAHQLQPEAQTHQTYSPNRNNTKNHASTPQSSASSTQTLRKSIIERKA